MDIEPIYQDTLNYLYSFVDFSMTRGFRYSPDKFELGRMRDFMAHFGAPHTAYPILHIAGTKGKGSVSAMCASVLRAAGYRVGLYTSPHLQDYAERIQLDGQPISHSDLITLVDEIRPYLDQGTQLTTFEITTGLAMLYFARQGANAVVLEVGLGGRLDATNIVAPLLTVITSISYDHTAILGETLAEIAGEKAGIIKQGVPVVLSPQKEEARLVIERIAAERAAPLTYVGRDYHYSPQEHSPDGQSLLVWSDSEDACLGLESSEGTAWQPTRLTIPLLGRHQVENAATAYAALQASCDCGLSLNSQAMQTGFAEVSWPARFEILRRQPPVVIDSAHNRDSAQKLRQTLDDYFPGLPVVMVFGASEDKDVDGMFQELMPRVDMLVVTRSYHPRAMELQQLVELAQHFNKSAVQVEAIEDALPEAVRLAGSEAMVLVTGSIFIAAGARHTWYNRSLEKTDEK